MNTSRLPWRGLAVATLACLFVGTKPVRAAPPIQILIDPAKTVNAVSPHLTAACIEDVNHEVYGGLYSQMIFGESFQEPAPKNGVSVDDNTSGMWRTFSRGEAKFATSIVRDDVFVGSQSQRLSFTSGNGTGGIENRGLNRQGMHFAAKKAYEGRIWARAAKATTISVALSSADGVTVYATADVSVTDGAWHRYDFQLVPDAECADGRFEIALKGPGTVDLGYAYLEPGEWGRFKGLPVRRDVAEALVDQGITALRFGGSIINNGEYRWKKMIGPRDRRQPYKNIWYNHATNGWAIIDFLAFTEAAGFMAIPAFSIDESPQDMLDFIEYATGPATSEWGAKRLADGHPEPLTLTHLELGNEERVDDAYFNKFEAIARLIWAKYPKLVLTVGDFTYTQPIVDPFKFEGADSHITTLAAHQKILALAREFDAEVWFDIHVWTEKTVARDSVRPWLTYIDAIDKLAGGAKHHVAIFEFNANAHSQERALANAQALISVQRDGRLPFAASANCLQVDGHNNNGWDQGLLFLNPAQVWLQPPGLMMQMVSRNYQPRLVTCTFTGGPDALDAIATASADEKTMVIQSINTGDAPITILPSIAGWKADATTQTAQTLAADLGAKNTSKNPKAVQPATLAPDPGGAGAYTLPPHSFTVIRFTR